MEGAAIDGEHFDGARFDGAVKNADTIRVAERELPRHAVVAAHGRSRPVPSANWGWPRRINLGNAEELVVLGARQGMIARRKGPGERREHGWECASHRARRSTTLAYAWPAAAGGCADPCVVKSG